MHMSLRYSVNFCQAIIDFMKKVTDIEVKIADVDLRFKKSFVEGVQKLEQVSNMIKPLLEEKLDD